MKAKLFELPDEQIRFIEDFRDETGGTQVGAVRTGVRLLREAVAAVRKGGRLAIVAADGSQTVLAGPWDDVKPRKVG